jgi:cytosine/adenosine deaminase-related metal-dependent hydrolase
MGLLIRNAVVVPVDPPGLVLDPGWVHIEGARITSLGPGEPPPSGADDRVSNADGGLVLPGFISAHQHLLDVLLRGGPPSGPTFLDWLLGLYYAGMAAYRPEDAGVATLLGLVETVRAGVTCVVDNWGVNNGSDPARVRECADASLAAYRACGVRVVFARMFATQIPHGWRGHWPTDLDTLITTPDQAMAAIDDLIRTYSGADGGRVQVCPSPELPEMVSDEVLAAALDLAGRNNTIMPTHLLASPESRAAADARRLERRGLLDARLLGAHCTAATLDDITRLARQQVKVAHCPTSNSFRGAVAPVAAMLEAGITVGLGSDNATLNCNSDILAEMRRAVLTSRLAGAPDDALTPQKALEMATIDGAAAIGLGDTAGSLTPGKRADLIIVDTTGPHWWPRHDWVAALVFQAKSTDVRTVVIDGNVVMEDRELTFLDPDGEQRLCHAAQAASQGVLNRAHLRSRG